MAFALGLGLFLFSLRTAGIFPLSLAEACWLIATATLLLLILRVAWYAGQAQLSARRGEMIRWVALGLLATWVLQPCYHAGGIGAGDAHWYTVMLGDFVEQLRAGVFPVWAGQSEYAFNGAVIPLRVAPLFQHEGGILDLLTWQSLEALPLRNLTLAINGLVIAFAMYGALRALSPRRPGFAAVVAGLFLCSPAVIAPLYAGDQFMTFIAIPFLPAVFYGLWRFWERKDFVASIWLAIGLAGLWLAHSPIGMWTTFCAAAGWLGFFVFRHERALAFKQGLGTAVLFGLLASFPFLSTLSIDNTNPEPTYGDTAVTNLKEAFPANFQPISSTANKLTDYQPGYAVLGLFVLGLLFWQPSRAPKTAVFVGLALLLAIIIIPLPWITEWFWMHLPPTVLLITNVWPMQRLMVIWAAVMLFATTLAITGSPNRRWRPRFLLGIAVILGLWSLREVAKFHHAVRQTITTGAAARLFLTPPNRIITRYSYSSFSRFPTYYSHGYMDPIWENRLLRRDGQTLLVANGEGALRGEPVQQGTFMALNDNNSNYYALSPSLSLEPGRHYALKLEFLIPPEHGYFQIHGDGFFHEYILPDSGSGIHLPAETRAFGSFPQSFHALSLWSTAPHPVTLRLRYIATDRPKTPTFPFARFSLYSYQTKDLPIRIRSWIPYTATTYVAEPAWLETPRMWLGRYRATVNGHAAEVGRSPNNLAMIRLDLGSNEVVLRYEAGLVLSASYWIGLFCWLTLASIGAAKILSAARSNQGTAPGSTSGAV